MESFALTANPNVRMPAAKLPTTVATTAQVAEVRRLTDINTAKVGVPTGGTDGQILGSKDGAPVWQAAPAQVSPRIEDYSVEPKKLRARILEEVLQHGSKAENFSVYTFGNAGDNFIYKGVTGRVNRARLELQNSVFELRWTGFANRQQLSGLMIRITSGTEVQEFAADSGTDFNLGESSYLQVNTAGLSTRPLAIDVYIAEHDDVPKDGEMFIVNDDDSGEWRSRDDLVNNASQVQINKAGVEDNRRAAAAAALSATSAQNRADTAVRNAATADGKAVAAQDNGGRGADNRQPSIADGAGRRCGGANKDNAVAGGQPH